MEDVRVGFQNLVAELEILEKRNANAVANRCSPAIRSQWDGFPGKGVDCIATGAMPAD